VALWALERPKGHTLFSSFFRAGRGRGTRLVRSPDRSKVRVQFI
jgi:hypothetical protein